MKKINDKTIGLIGGMGPLATSYFYDLLVKKSELNYAAKNNEDYPRIFIDSVPVQDFISDTNNLDKAKNLLTQSVKNMNRNGVNVLAMICNTAHILYEDLSKNSQAEFLSIINLVAQEAKKRKIKKVGILATPTTLKYNLYKKELQALGIQVFYINHQTSKQQEIIIREIVAGKITKAQGDYLYKITLDFIKTHDLDGIILGCTELPLVFPKNRFKNVLDCLDILADELLRRYYV